MAVIQEHKRIRFEPFEFDVSTGELRKNGTSIRLQGQPARLLGLLLSRPGELVSRTDIQKALWPDGRFVEFEHAINTAVKKVREALGDDPENPSFVETLPKLGYRFMAPVDPVPQVFVAVKPEQTNRNQPLVEAEFFIPYPRFSRFAFLLIQVGYLVIYCCALYYIAELESGLAAAGFVPIRVTFPAALVTAMCGIAVRLYLISAVGWRHPAAGGNFYRLFPFLLVLDELWATSPLLAMKTLAPGMALAGVAGLAYLPFAQRTLVQAIYKKTYGTGTL